MRLRLEAAVLSREKRLRRRKRSEPVLLTESLAGVNRGQLHRVGRLPIGRLAFATRTRQNRRPPFRSPPRIWEGMASALERERERRNFNGHRIPDALLKVISHSPKGQGTRRSVVPFLLPLPLSASSRLFLRFRAPSRTDPPSFSPSFIEDEGRGGRDWKSAWLEFSSSSNFFTRVPWNLLAQDSHRPRRRS